MEAITIAFQGESGAYSELAAINHFREGIETIPCDLLISSKVFYTTIQAPDLDL